MCRVPAVALLLLACALCVQASISSKSRLRKVSEDELGSNVISNAKLQKDAVQERNIQPGAVGGAQIADHAIEDRHIQPHSVTSRNMALEEVTIILRASTSVSATGGGALSNPQNRIALKPLNSGGRVQNHHVRPDGFHSAFGRASGPGTIVGWYPSLNGHLLRYQADRALRELSCSGVFSIDHKIRKYDVNVADYGVTYPTSFDCSPPPCVPFGEPHLLPRFWLTGSVSDGDFNIIDVSAYADTLLGGTYQERFPGVVWPGLTTYGDNDNDITTSDMDTAVENRPFGPINASYFSSIASLTHQNESRLNAFATGLPPTRQIDYDLRGTRDVHYLSHRYVDMRYGELCGDLVADFGPDNVKCLRARPWQERQYVSNDVRSAGGEDTTDNIRPDVAQPESIPGVVFDSANDRNLLDRGFVDALYDVTVTSPNVEPIPEYGWEHATSNSPPERCSIYTNIGDVRNHNYLGNVNDPSPIDIPGRAEGTPVYSPSLERIQIDDKGVVEVRYAGRGMPGASQPDIAITVMVLRNDAVQYQPDGNLPESFP